MDHAAPQPTARSAVSGPREAVVPRSATAVILRLTAVRAAKVAPVLRHRQMAKVPGPFTLLLRSTTIQTQSCRVSRRAHSSCPRGPSTSQQPSPALLPPFHFSILGTQPL